MEKFRIFFFLFVLYSLSEKKKTGLTWTNIVLHRILTVFIKIIKLSKMNITFGGKHMLSSSDMSIFKTFWKKLELLLKKWKEILAFLYLNRFRDLNSYEKFIW